MKAQETLEAFFERMRKKDVKFSDVMPLLTKTQQENSLYIGRITAESHLTGIHELVNKCKKVEVKEKKVTDVVADMTVTFYAEKKAKFACRLIKELDPYKPGKDGEWGLNINSFKLLK